MSALARATDSTPYEPERRRLRLMEKIVSARRGVSIETARAILGRAIRLTPDQQANIRKRKRKDLYGSTKDTINAAFVGIARKVIDDLAREMELAARDGSRLDPRLVARAQAQMVTLEELIAEEAGERAGGRPS